jgi:hypothetical protein
MNWSPGARVVACLLSLAACAQRGGRPFAPLPEVQGGAEISIHRGPDIGMALKVRPPHAVGPYSNMTIRRGRISGIHCGGGFAITAAPDRISGHGPGGGVVEMEVWGDDSEINAEGLWNGAYGHLEATPDSLRVSLAMAPTRVERGRVIHARSRSYSFRRSGEGLFTGEPRVNGTPEWMSLAVPERVRAYLSREELLAILMTLFAGAAPSGLPDPFACGQRG